MNWRLFSAALLCVLALGVDLLLVQTEDIVGIERKKGDTRRGDPLFGMTFTPGTREANFKAMGFEADEVQAIVTIIRALEKQYRLDDAERNVILARIDTTEDLAGLQTALCGTGSSGMAGASLPVRYEALKYLVTDEDGQRAVVNLNDIPGFEYQEWSTNSRVNSIYEQAELGSDRRGDASRMAIAAVMAGTRGEADFLEHRGGWGGILWTGWSWERVQQEHPGVRQRVFEYLALMHLAAEQAHTAEGICRDAGSVTPPPDGL